MITNNIKNRDLSLVTMERCQVGSHKTYSYFEYVMEGIPQVLRLTESRVQN